MDELVRWLGEQLDEDERIARACSGAPWEIEISPMVHVSVEARRDNKWKWGRLGYVATVERDEDRAHIARHDPARVLAEIGAKRQVLADFEESLKRSKEFSRRAKSGEETEVQKQQRHEENIRLLVLLKVVKQLASACSDRPGYAEALASLG